MGITLKNTKHRIFFPGEYLTPSLADRNPPVLIVQSSIGENKPGGLCPSSCIKVGQPDVLHLPVNCCSGSVIKLTDIPLYLPAR